MSRLILILKSPVWKEGKKGFKEWQSYITQFMEATFETT